MQATQAVPAVSADDYLAGELQSQVRHEFLGGVVYAMAGGSEDHNTISLNLAFALRSHLRGGPCKVAVADMKVRLNISAEDVFYYPDVMVACDARDKNPYYKQFPKVLIEVLSPQTEQTDRREKFLSYIQIETLEEYILVAQDRREVTIHRRAQKWQPETLSGNTGSLDIRSLGITIPMDVIYEGVRI